MACTTFDTSKYFSGNYTYQKNFLTNCKTWFEEMVHTSVYEVGGRSYRSYPVRFLELLHIQYERGVRNGWLLCSYGTFEAYILGKPDPDAPPPVRHRPYRSWCRHYTGAYYREGTKYRKNTAHEKKEKSQRQVWREDSGIERDKRKCHWRNGRKTFYKKLRNRQMRREVAVILENEERWDELFYSPSPPDRWAWD